MSRFLRLTYKWVFLPSTVALAPLALADLDAEIGSAYFLALPWADKAAEELKKNLAALNNFDHPALVKSSDVRGLIFEILPLCTNRVNHLTLEFLKLLWCQSKHHFNLRFESSAFATDRNSLIKE